MKHERFQDWLSQFNQLTSAQQQQAIQLFQQKDEAKLLLEAIELNVDKARTCPRCSSPGAMSRGRSRGLRRYQCKACCRYFNATTGTPLQGLHHKERWLKFGQCLSSQETVEESASNCGIAASTAFRWRHRFLQVEEQSPLAGTRSSGGD